MDSPLEPSKFNLTTESFRIKTSYQPVLTFLLEKGKEEVLSDPYGFSLNFENSFCFPQSINSKPILSVGLTYDEGGFPQFWGCNFSMRHELKSFWIKDENQDAKKMATRIRCVAD